MESRYPIRSGGESGPNGCGRLGQLLEHAISIQRQILDTDTPSDQNAKWRH